MSDRNDAFKGKSRVPSVRDGRGKSVSWNKPRRAQLTDAFVEALPRPPAGKKDYWMRDTRIPGFSVRVYAPNEHGVATKVFGYTIAIGEKEKYFPIGRFGVMTAATARSEAQKIDANIRAGLDPFAHRIDVSLATVNDLFEDWKKNFWGTGLQASTQERYQRFWDRFIPRSFKILQLSQVELSHIQDIQQKIAKGGIKYTRRRKVNFVEVRSAPSEIQANRVVTMLSGMFKYQLNKRPEKRQGLDHNPCKPVALYMEPESWVYLAHEDQLRLRTFLEAPDSRCQPYSRDDNRFAGQALDAIALIFHTGLRHHEALGLDWSNVHWDLGTLSFKVTKYGAKRPRVARTKYIRITSPAKALLQRLWEAGGRPKKGWVFQAHLDAEKHWNNIQGTWDGIRAILDLPESCRLHDLRHCMATDLLRAGLDRGEVQQYMGWESVDSANRYMHVVVSETHLKAEAIIATRGIGGPDAGAASAPKRSSAASGAQPRGLLQDVVERSRDLLELLGTSRKALPARVKKAVRDLQSAMNPDLACEEAWTHGERFQVASRATELLHALAVGQGGLAIAGLNQDAQKAVRDLEGPLKRIGLIESR